MLRYRADCDNIFLPSVSIPEGGLKIDENIIIIIIILRRASVFPELPLGQTDRQQSSVFGLCYSCQGLRPTLLPNAAVRYYYTGSVSAARRLLLIANKCGSLVVITLYLEIT